MVPGQDRRKSIKAERGQKEKRAEVWQESLASNSQDAVNFWSITNISGEISINKQQQPKKLHLQNQTKPKQYQSRPTQISSKLGGFLETFKPSKISHCSMAPGDWLQVSPHVLASFKTTFFFKGRYHGLYFFLCNVGAWDVVGFQNAHLVNELVNLFP